MCGIGWEPNLLEYIMPTAVRTKMVSMKKRESVVINGGPEETLTKKSADKSRVSTVTKANRRRRYQKTAKRIRRQYMCTSIIPHKERFLQPKNVYFGSILLLWHTYSLNLHRILRPPLSLFVRYIILGDLLLYVFI